MQRRPWREAQYLLNQILQIKLADLMDSSSNQLAEILADWNTVLQQSKLAQTKPSNTNEGEQTDAPQAGTKRLLRTRKRA